jgi:hypothetical protein
MKRNRRYMYFVAYEVQNVVNGVVDKTRTCSLSLNWGSPLTYNRVSELTEKIRKGIDFPGYKDFDVLIRSISKLTPY